MDRLLSGVLLWIEQSSAAPDDALAVLRFLWERFPMMPSNYVRRMIDLADTPGMESAMRRFLGDMHDKGHFLGITIPASD
jgi:hypothetical protein